VALTAFQQGICRLLAPTRMERESYVAGGVALNTLLQATRRSRDVDLFHDTAEAVSRTIEQDSQQLRDAGYEVHFVRQAPTFAEAVVEKDGETSLMQWVQESAYRFFPLIENAELGLALHPFDLATNKVLAMAGRLEPRDWIDLITCHRQLQPLGYLVWAACGKDPGFSPISLLQEIRRASRYSQAELDVLDFDGRVPNAAQLGSEWHAMLREAKAVCDILPADKAGTCVCRRRDELCTASPDELAGALAEERLWFHSGSIGGAWPSFPAG
jgi:hypothetical protein